jgi:hypothetical protein
MAHTDALGVNAASSAYHWRIEQRRFDAINART